MTPRQMAFEQTGAQRNAEHLTDEQFSDLLAGDNAPEGAMAHLDACAHCRAELDEIRFAMGSMNEMSLAWAELEAPRRIQTPSRWAIHRRAIPAWGLATAAALFIAAVSLHHAPQRSAEVATVAETASVPAASPDNPVNENLADDNRLMMSIDQELGYKVQPTVPVTELRTSGSARYGARQVAN